MSTESDPAKGPGRAPAGGEEPLVSPAGGEDPIGSPLGGDEPASAEPGGAGTAPAGAGDTPPLVAPTSGQPDSLNMLPPRERRRSRVERLLVRLIATAGIVGIGVAIGAIMVSQHSQGWLVGGVVSVVTVVLAAILWSSRQL